MTFVQTYKCANVYHIILICSQHSHALFCNLILELNENNCDFISYMNNEQHAFWCAWHSAHGTCLKAFQNKYQNAIWNFMWRVCVCVCVEILCTQVLFVCVFAWRQPRRTDGGGFDSGVVFIVLPLVFFFVLACLAFVRRFFSTKSTRIDDTHRNIHSFIQPLRGREIGVQHTHKYTTSFVFYTEV